MPVEHLPSNVSPEQVVEILRRDGCVVIDRVVDRAAIGRVLDEMAPYIEGTDTGSDEFSGSRTRRTGGLVARSPAARTFVMNDLVLGSVKRLLEKATNHRLHLSQIIAIGPGESAQSIHRDQWAFDFFPFPTGFEVQCNTLWAMTDFTEENGATRVIPGSHAFEDGLQLKIDDTEPAEMEAGSVLLYTGSLYHGGGANHSDTTRYGLNLTYARGWLRQEENQYLSVPQQIARELPDDLLRLIGYAPGAYALGYVDDLRDPLKVLKREAGATGLGDLEQAARQARRSASGS